MIFLTVGTQFGFDRLVSAVDAWCASRPDAQVFGQIGSSRLQPSHFEWVQWLDRSEHVRRLRDAQGVVSHAGMGTILQCRDERKPLLVMPRRAGLGECINDHQWTMAHKLDRLGLIRVAYDENEMPARLDALLENAPLPAAANHRDALIARISAFLNALPT